MSETEKLSSKNVPWSAIYFPSTVLKAISEAHYGICLFVEGEFADIGYGRLNIQFLLFTCESEEQAMDIINAKLPDGFSVEVYRRGEFLWSTRFPR